MIQRETYEWYAIRTKFKCEKFVRDLLLKRDIEAYVPILIKKKRYTRKIKTYELPLIHCYVFVRISRKEYLEVLKMQYVVGFVQVSAGHITPIPSVEMDLMKRVVGERDEVQISPVEWQVGDPVEIIGGNLTGMTGKLVEQNGKKEFIVDLESIGFQIRMVIEDKYLRKVPVSGLFV